MITKALLPDHEQAHESDNYHHSVIHVPKLSIAILHCCDGKRMIPITRSAGAGAVPDVNCVSAASSASIKFCFCESIFPPLITTLLFIVKECLLS